MKIRAIDTTILSVPTPTPIALEYPEHRLVVASIETDEGRGGLGYYELSIHVVGALANGFLVLFTGLPRCEDGHLPISDAPGHGLAFVPGAEKKYRFAV